MITLMYGGGLVGYIMLSIFGDVLGRKSMMLVNLGFIIVGTSVAGFSQSLLMGGIGIFLVLFGAKLCYNITFVFIT